MAVADTESHSEIEAPLENEINFDFTLLQQHPSSTLSTTARRVPLPPSRMWAGARQLRLEQHTTTRTATSRQPAVPRHHRPTTSANTQPTAPHPATNGVPATRDTPQGPAPNRAPRGTATRHPPPAQPYALSPPRSQSAVSTASSYPTSTPTSSRSRSTTTSPTSPLSPHGATPPPPTSTTTPTAASTATATSRRRSSGSCSTSALARPATAGSRAWATTGAGWALGRDSKVKERSGRHQDTPSNIHSDERQGMKNRGKTRQEGDPKAPCLLPSASAHSPPPYPFAAAIPIRYHCPPHPPQVHEAAEGDDRPPLSPFSPSDAVHLNPSHGITVGGDVRCWRHG
ncbi:hypothetical protein BJ912DRAFT_1142989 [Pholiota molesta]|nr:hypothetical protein BJ912DRAFT_1142989 [Pholiota molesta]